MNIFRRSKKPETTEVIAEPLNPAEEKLKERFRKAAYGSHFRTRSFLRAAAPEEPSWAKEQWLEAIAPESPDSWRVQRVTRGTDPASQKTVRTLWPLKEGLGFFEAMRELLQFEATQPGLGFVVADEPTLETLGPTHVVAFARREGIAFDIEDKPHPTTAEGLVVANAGFTDEALEAARNAVARKKQDFSITPLPDALTPRQRTGSGKEIVFCGNPDMAEMLCALYELRDFMREAASAGWHARNQKHPEAHSYGACLLDKVNATAALFQKHNENLFSSAEAQAAKETLSRAFCLMLYYAGLGCARDAVANRNKTFSTGVGYNQQREEQIVAVLVYALRGLGHADLDKDSTYLAALLNQKDEADGRYPEEIDRIIEWFEDTLSSLLSRMEQAPEPVAPPKIMLPAFAPGGM